MVDTVLSGQIGLSKAVEILERRSNDITDFGRAIAHSTRGHTVHFGSSRMYGRFDSLAGAGQFRQGE